MQRKDQCNERQVQAVRLTSVPPMKSSIALLARLPLAHLESITLLVGWMPARLPVPTPSHLLTGVVIAWASVASKAKEHTINRYVAILQYMREKPYQSLSHTHQI